MPEGDSVRATAQQLERALSGHELVAAELRWPSLAGVRITGRMVVETVSRGKHLLTRLDRDGDRPALTLHSHLRMDGQWRTWATGNRRLPGPTTPARAILVTSTFTAVGLKLGMLDLVPTTAEDRLVGHLGPDVLGQDWDPGEALRRLRGEPDRPVADALLDQHLLAGLGTYWASEALHLQGIAVHRPTGQGGDELDALVHRLPSLLQVPRRPPARVYGRRDLPCQRCGARIRTTRLGPPERDRQFYWCPGCQR
ncbi:MAG: DNA-formamidopyrimidine glycosylase family protein [Actinomycetales bacterium]